MDNDIKMKYCRLLDEESNQYLFYLDDEIQIAMGGRYDVPKCTCGANERGIACKVSVKGHPVAEAVTEILTQHIFWMLDQLASKASQKIKGQTLEVTANGSSIQDKEPAEIIDNATLERVADSLDWVLHEGPIPEDEEIEDEIAEMLSVFEPSGALPSEFKNADGFQSERSRKYSAFKDLLTELFTEHGTKNLGLLNRFQAVIDPEFQAQVFFEKINYRVAHCFEALDEYISHGSTAAHSEAHDVPTCARKLKGIVKAVDEYYHQQKNNGLDTTEIAPRAAAALISILDGVVRRNLDAYANITWEGIPPEDPEENNLFVCCIGAPSDRDGLFVLDALRNLPTDDILRNHWESLSGIKARLNPQWTPRPFMHAFCAFISDDSTEGRKRASSGSGGSSPKRSMQ